MVYAFNSQNASDISQRISLVQVILHSVCIPEGDYVFLDLVSEVVAPVYGAVAIVLVSVEPARLVASVKPLYLPVNPTP